METKMQDKMQEFVKKNLGYLVVFITCAIYIAMAIVEVGKTGKTIEQIIADGAIAFFMGIFINRTFDLQGMMIGENDENVIATRKLHGDTITAITPYINMIDPWVAMQNAENYKNNRTRILARVGLKYSECFTDDGVAIPYAIDRTKMYDKNTKKIELMKYAGYKRAVKLKLTPLTAGELTSEGGKSDDPFYFGRTKLQYERQRNRSNFTSKLVIALIFGYFGVKLIQDISWANVIWNATQVAIFVSMGVVQMYQTIQYVTTEYRGRIIKKIDNLEKFKNYAENHKETNNGEEK